MDYFERRDDPQSLFFSGRQTFSLSQSECLTQPIQVLLSQNQKIFSQLFSAFPKVTQNLKFFKKKDDPCKSFFSEIIDWKKQGYLNGEKASCQNTYGQSTC